jgi:hypothetical protein
MRRSRAYARQPQLEERYAGTRLLTMRYALTAIFVAVATASPSASADGTLEIVPTAATATVAADGRGRRPVRLPALHYEFQLLHSCRAPMTARSLSLTVADSHRFVDAAALAADNGNARLSVTIPAAQLAPVILSDFCAAEPASDDTAESMKTLPALLSASASLRCASEDGERTIYNVAPLDVVLVCEAGNASREPESGTGD